MTKIEKNSKKPNIVRRLYDWVVSLAEKPWALLALFVLSFAESSVFPIPPDVLLIPMVLGARTKAMKIATVCTVGSVLGGMFGYYIGHTLWYDGSGNPTGLAQWFFNHAISAEKFDNLKNWYAEYGFGAVFVAGFTPFPYKVITIFSGVSNLPFGMFVLSSVLSRGARFFIVAWLLKKYGDPVQAFIDKRFNILAIIFCVILGLGFYFLKVAH